MESSLVKWKTVGMEKGNGSLGVKNTGSLNKTKAVLVKWKTVCMDKGNGSSGVKSMGSLNKTILS